MDYQNFESKIDRITQDYLSTREKLALTIGVVDQGHHLEVIKQLNPAVQFITQQQLAIHTSGLPRLHTVSLQKFNILAILTFTTRRRKCMQI